ncbi:MAG: hypothetical protein IH830_01755 [Planctomycetes bacterium]|nr:hypothetical protein [Planctomycetota bacterium]
MRCFHWSNSDRRFGFAWAFGLSAAYVAVAVASGQPKACSPEAGPCDVPHQMPGCDDTCGDDPCLGCCEAVCAVNPLCCSLNWDALCVQLASKLCVPKEACGVPGTGDCFSANGSPFCDDTCGGQDCAGCCLTVCGVDPYCCNVDWDGFCVDEAEDFCTCEPDQIPANDNCEDATAIAEGVFEFTTVCATHDGTDPEEGPCWDGFTGIGADVWFNYTASFTGPVRVHTCGQADFAAKLAVYAGCECPLTKEMLIECNDGGCPADGSEVIFDAVEGDCYTIRLGGGYLDPAGSGTVTIEPTGPPPTGACCFLDGSCMDATTPAECTGLGGTFQGDETDCANVDCTPPKGANFFLDPAAFEAAVSAAGKISKATWNFKPNNLPPASVVAIDDPQNINTHSADPDDPWTDAGGDDLWPPELDNVSFQSNDGPNPQPPGPNPGGVDGLAFATDGFLGLPTNALLANTFVDSFDILSGPPAGDNHTAMALEIITASSGGGGIFVTVHDMNEEPVGKIDIDVASEEKAFLGIVMEDGLSIGRVNLYDPTDGAEGISVITVYLSGGPACPWDLNGSGDVGILDLLALLAAWGPCEAPCPPDFDGGGTVDIFDLLTLIANWGACP